MLTNFRQAEKQTDLEPVNGYRFASPSNTGQDGQSRSHNPTRKQSYPVDTSAKAKLFARWRHHLRFCSGSLMPPL